MSEKINKQAKNKNKQKQSEDLTDSSVRKIKEWFNASLNELKTKVSQKEVDYESLQADFEDLEEKLKKLSNSNQKQLTDFSKLEMKVEKIKAGAVSSAALASAMSQNNGSKIDMETIERIELRQVKAGLDSEVQS